MTIFSATYLIVVGATQSSLSREEEHQNKSVLKGKYYCCNWPYPLINSTHRSVCYLFRNSEFSYLCLCKYSMLVYLLTCSKDRANFGVVPRSKGAKIQNSVS